MAKKKQDKDIEQQSNSENTKGMEQAFEHRVYHFSSCSRRNQSN